MSLKSSRLFFFFFFFEICVYVSLSAEVGCKGAPETYCGDHGTCNQSAVCACDEMWEGQQCENGIPQSSPIKKKRSFAENRNNWDNHFEWRSLSWGNRISGRHAQLRCPFSFPSSLCKLILFFSIKDTRCFSQVLGL